MPPRRSARRRTRGRRPARSARRPPSLRYGAALRRECGRSRVLTDPRLLRRLAGGSRRALEFPWRPARADLALEPLQLELDVATAAHLVELGLDVVARSPRDVLEGTRGQQLVDRAGACLHLGGLVLGTLDSHADVAHLLGDAGERLVDPGL